MDTITDMTALTTKVSEKTSWFYLDQPNRVD